MAAIIVPSRFAELTLSMLEGSSGPDVIVADLPSNLIEKVVNARSISDDDEEDDVELNFRARRCGSEVRTSRRELRHKQYYERYETLRTPMSAQFGMICCSASGGPMPHFH
jgi:hypothetical protein